MTDIRRSKKVLDVCDQLVSLTVEKRKLYLDEYCEGDAELRAAVVSLLSAIEDSGSFLIPDEEVGSSETFGEKSKENG